MPKSVTDVLSKVKTSCDNDTLLFCFENKEGVAYDRETLYKTCDAIVPPRSYYEKLYGSTLSTIPSGIYFYDSSERHSVDENGNSYGYVVYKTEIETTYTQDPEDPTKQIEVKTPKFVDTGFKTQFKTYTYDSGVSESFQVYVNSDNCYYNKKVMKRFPYEHLLGIYYKNTNGVWINYNLIKNDVPDMISLKIAAVQYEDRFKIPDLKVLPACTFIDSDNHVHHIDAWDGNTFGESVTYDELNTNDYETVRYEPFEIDNPTLTFQKRALMHDLKITVPSNKRRKNFLVWLNGALVPTTGDATSQNIMYLRNALTMIGSKCVDQIQGSGHTTTSNATVVEDESNNVYRYDVNLRMFSWKGVSVSDFLMPVSIDQAAITYNYSQIFITKNLYFQENVNENAHMIICNGRVLQKDEYYVDPDNPKKVVLTKVVDRANELLVDLIKDIEDYPDYYTNVKPLRLLYRTLSQKTYSLVNFESEDSSKELYLRQSNSCAVNFPYKNEITFSKLNIGDLVLIKGLYVPYLIEHANTIKLPRTKYSFDETKINSWEEADYLKESEVVRYFFEVMDKE